MPYPEGHSTGTDASLLGLSFLLSGGMIESVPPIARIAVVFWRALISPHEDLGQLSIAAAHQVSLRRVCRTQRRVSHRAGRYGHLKDRVLFILVDVTIQVTFFITVAFLIVSAFFGYALLWPPQAFGHN